jgi:phosphatidylglycerophosphatase C
VKRNVYDFDGTIYYGDSTVDFYRFCARRYPRILLDLPFSGGYYLGMALGLCTKTRAKQRFYHFLSFLREPEALVEIFWQRNQNKIKPWYREKLQPQDLIISASPEFLLQPICDLLGVQLIASRVDPHTGMTAGLNCHDREKVRRMKELLPDTQIHRFYSDSPADTPLALLAEEAFLVRGDVITPFFSKEKNKK